MSKTIQNTAQYNYSVANTSYATEAACDITVYSATLPSVTMTKTADKIIAYIGDVITYTLTIEIGNSEASLEWQSIEDSIPSGLQFVTGTVTVDGISMPTAEPYYFEVAFESNRSHAVTYQCIVV